MTDLSVRFQLVELRKSSLAGRAGLITVPENLWRVIEVNSGDASFSGFEVGLFPVNDHCPNFSSQDAISPLDQEPYVTYYKNGGAGAGTIYGERGDDMLSSELSTNSERKKAKRSHHSIRVPRTCGGDAIHHDGRRMGAQSPVRARSERGRWAL